MSDDELEIGPKEPVKEKPVKKKRRHTRQQRPFGLWMLLSIVFVTGLFVMIGLSLSGRALTVPTFASNWAVERVNNSFPASRISLGKMAFQVNEKGIPQIILQNLGVFDQRGAELVRLNDVRVRISAQDLLRGRIQPTVLRLSGAQMTLRRKVDGQFDLSFGAGTSTSGTLSGLLDSIDTAFETEPLSGVQKVEIDALTVTIEDARSARIWQVTQGQMQLSQEEDNLDITLAFDVFNGTEELAKVGLGIITDRTSSAATIGVSFENAAAGDIALQSPALSFLGVLDAPISGAVRSAFSTQGELGSLAGTLQIDEGALKPSAATRPLAFQSARAYFNYFPDQEKLVFSEVSVKADSINVQTSGHAYLRDLDEGWPSQLLGQFAISKLDLNPIGLLPEPISFSQGAVDVSLRLDPFEVKIGQAVLTHGNERFQATGNISAGEKGWEVSSDLVINQMSRERLLALWPAATIPNTRNWFSNNVQEATLNNIHVAARLLPEVAPRLSLGFEFSDSSIKFLKTLPNVTAAAGYATLGETMFALGLERGQIVAPTGGPIDLAGSFLRIPDINARPGRLEVSLAGKSTTTAALSLMNEPPFRVLRNAPIEADVASGNVDFKAEIAFDLKPKLTLPDVSYELKAQLFNLKTSTLVPGHSLRAAKMELTASPAHVEIHGPVEMGNVKANVQWKQGLSSENSGESHVRGSVELSQSFVDEFNIGLPKGSISGSGTGDFDLTFVSGQLPTFTLTSNLAGVGLRIAAIDWSKSRKSSANLTVLGHLGSAPAIDNLGLSAVGLTVSGGKITSTATGGLKTASFKRVKAGNWLDAPVVLTGRGKNVAPAITINGGTVDIRNTSFGRGSSGGSAQSGPLTLALDRLTVSQGIALTSFSGKFDLSKGISGDFTARVNGKTQVTGGVRPNKNGTRVRIRSNDAGGVVRAAGVFDSARKGSLNMTLTPTAQNGVYNGRVIIKNTRVVDAPAITELLNAISIVGLLDQMAGSGISFTNVEADFSLTPKRINLKRSSAVGPSLGISLDGVYDLASSRMQMQGVLSPVYFLNAIGQIFSRKGEGLFGFNFRLSGTAEKPTVQVNPLSILTPGIFRDIFRAPPPKAN